MADAIIEKQTGYVTEQEEHQKRISENYRKLLDSASPAEKEDTRPRPAPQYYAPHPAQSAQPAPYAENAPAATLYADNAARLRDYNAYRVPAGKRTLFDGMPQATEDLVMSVPAAQAAAPAMASVSEDALPTPRTMAMLNRAEEEMVEEARMGFFAALPTKLKAALLVVMSAVLAAVAVIWINSSVLRSMDSRIESEKAAILELEQRSSEVKDQLSAVQDPQNIAAWAERSGMIRQSAPQA